mmetsp:Transcript_17030/g.51049  ORF Transcript_17030/g.51049 Transcript_17030/m.51049 type:complete len:235 (+) Transcript_17030:119-823(+)
MLPDAPAGGRCQPDGRAARVLVQGHGDVSGPAYGGADPVALAGGRQGQGRHDDQDPGGGDQDGAGAVPVHPPLLSGGALRDAPAQDCRQARLDPVEHRRGCSRVPQQPLPQQHVPHRVGQAGHTARAEAHQVGLFGQVEQCTLALWAAVAVVHLRKERGARGGQPRRVGRGPRRHDRPLPAHLDVPDAHRAQPRIQRPGQDGRLAAQAARARSQGRAGPHRPGPVVQPFWAGRG